MQKAVKALLVGAAVWMGSFLGIWTLLKLATPHMEIRFSDTIIWGIILLLATLNTLIVVVAKGIDLVIQRLCRNNQPMAIQALIFFVSVWLVSAGVTGVILGQFSTLMTLPISLRTLIILSCVYAATAALLNCILVYIPQGLGNDDDYQDAIAKTEPLTAAMPEQLTNHFERTGSKIIPFPAIKDRRS